MIGPSDHLAWAKKPRSHTAVQQLYAARKGDRRLRAIWDFLVQSGVVSEHGQAIKLWRDNAWVPAK